MLSSLTAVRFGRSVARNRDGLCLTTEFRPWPSHLLGTHFSVFRGLMPLPLCRIHISHLGRYNVFLSLPGSPARYLRFYRCLRLPRSFTICYRYHEVCPRRVVLLWGTVPALTATTPLVPAQSRPLPRRRSLQLPFRLLPPSLRRIHRHRSIASARRDENLPVSLPI